MSGVQSVVRRHSRTAIIASIAVIALALTIAARQLYSGSEQVMARQSCWYSIDDGATWFSDKTNRMPFEKDGKPAYQAHLFDDGSGKPFVGYLERFNPLMAKQLVQIRGGADVPGPEQMMSFGRIASVAREVKRPGDPDTAWTRASTEQAMLVMSMRQRAQASGSEVVEVFP